jgi:hypothetical protein
MTPIDLALAGAGRAYATLNRRARWAPAAVVAGLVLLSLLPVLIVGSTRQPNEISLADLEAQRIPAGATWFRVEGDLREATGAGPFFYTLHDLGDDARAVTVVADAALPTGHVELTGHQSGSPLRGTFLSIQADVTTEPARHDPWLLFAIPALLGIPIVVGGLRGYPVVRRDRGSSAVVAPVGQGERLSARWGGWIGNERHDLDAMAPCPLQVSCDADVCRMTITDADGVRTVPHRRKSPTRRIRLCRTSGLQHGLDLHAPVADLTLAFDEAVDRDRFAASIG